MDIKLTKKLKNHFREFLELHPPKRFGRNLRQMLFEYLDSGLRIGFPLYYNELIHGLEGLFELLDVAEDQLKKTKKSRKKINNGTKQKKRSSLK